MAEGMSYAEFHRAVRAIACNRYFSTAVCVSEHPDYSIIEIEWRAYLNGYKWVDGKTPEECLDALRLAPAPTTPPIDDAPLDAIGEVQP